MTFTENRRGFTLRRRILRRRPGGFAIVEMLITAGMMTILAMVFSSSWNSLGKTTNNVIARVQLAQEMDFTAAALSRDLGGCLTDPTPAAKNAVAFPNWSCNTSDPKNHILKIPVGNAAGDIIIYRRDTGNANVWLRNNLVRIYADSTETELRRFTVAKNVDEMTLDPDTVAKTLTIKVDFSCNYRPSEPTAPTARSYSLIKRTCVLVAGRPQ